MPWLEPKPKEPRPPKPRAVRHQLGMRRYIVMWWRHCLERDLMRDAMRGVFRLNVWYDDGSCEAHSRARRQLYRWARVHAAYFDVPLVAALYATMLVASDWQHSMKVTTDHGDYLTTRWSYYLQTVVG